MKKISDFYGKFLTNSTMSKFYNIIPMYGAPVALKEFDLSYVEHNIVLSQLILTWL